MSSSLVSKLEDYAYKALMAKSLGVSLGPVALGNFSAAFKDAATELLAAEARADALQAERDIALKLLNPVCAEETVVGAIRNLQQALLSTQGNVEEAEARADAAERALREIVALELNDRIVEEVANAYLDAHGIAEAALASPPVAPQVSAPTKCHLCKGSGLFQHHGPRTAPVTCGVCKGTGRVVAPVAPTEVIQDRENEASKGLLG